MFPKSRGARLKEMITPSIREGLQTKGYQLVGSHSAVKRCRWVLSSLRRHGGCYKHTFYGIESHRCMEATTSVACANRCTFCWRGSTHPNALKWGSFEADDPRWLVQQMVDKHLAKIIKPLKGAQVDDKSFSEALQPRHVALSLVGEPVMYPKMGEFLRAIHTPPYMVVTNGQHPEELANLPQVTQLYISIDASNAEELKKAGEMIVLRQIDRPLFKDYWERLLSSLKAAAEKKEKQRK
ncbi:S-adenosyl-L-methionine-dependent tRNA 4-demethylwyosine synthase, partial [Perkinsus olseni]